ncbi:hypothetical protein [Nocardioides sp. YIM 152315]|uniref:hypothetical protein n=1 Tax=Nocardioides sp. YIM 152315 TaxID=3031760 RepID=UPI0023DC8A3C|nr:hypothetical protein [Nocardioides sp. YIM 152315]MDF1605293.1 hypothetical protein [Nocardioides sp. YIM 152315]
MTDEDEERLARDDGHRYEAPESDETRVNKEWVYAVLGVLVLVLLVLIATGTVQIFPGG